LVARKSFSSLSPSSLPPSSPIVSISENRKKPRLAARGSLFAGWSPALASGNQTATSPRTLLLCLNQRWFKLFLDITFASANILTYNIQNP
jgi:hypothetical protein